MGFAQWTRKSCFFYGKTAGPCDLSSLKIAIQDKANECYNQSDTMIKATLLVLATLCLIRALHLDHTAQSKPEEHLLQMFGHDSALIKTKDVHEGNTDIERVRTGLDFLKNKYITTLQYGCKLGYKLTENINVYNLSPVNMVLQDQYMSIGKRLTQGYSPLKPGNSCQYIRRNDPQGYRTGLDSFYSIGSMVWVLPSPIYLQIQTRIGLIYVNRAAGFDFVGVLSAKNYYDYMINRYQRPECMYLDNRYKEGDNIAKNGYLTMSGYTVGLEVKFNNNLSRNGINCNADDVRLVVAFSDP